MTKFHFLTKNAVTVNQALSDLPIVEATKGSYMPHKKYRKVFKSTVEVKQLV